MRCNIAEFVFEEDGFVGEEQLETEGEDDAGLIRAEEAGEDRGWHWRQVRRRDLLLPPRAVHLGDTKAQWMRIAK